MPFLGSNLVSAADSNGSAPVAKDTAKPAVEMSISQEMMMHVMSQEIEHAMSQPDCHVKGAADPMDIDGSTSRAAPPETHGRC